MKLVFGRNQNQTHHNSVVGLVIRCVLQWTFEIAASVLLLALILTTCLDVIGRYFLDAPLVGAFEITELLLAALIFTALPLTTARREHVEVNLLAIKLPIKIQYMLSLLVNLFSAALLATFAWRLFMHAIQIAADGATTNTLAIPLAPVAYLASVCTCISAAIIVFHGWSLNRNSEHDEMLCMKKTEEKR